MRKSENEKVIICNNMKFLHFIFLTISSLSNIVTSCNNYVMRREWNTLTMSDKNQYIRAIRDLMIRKNSYQAIDPRIMSYHDFVELHVTHTPWIHGDPMFLPFHRGMIRQFELAILSTGKWNQGIVYWDWSKKYKNWHNDDIFHYLGNRFDMNSYCVITGNFTQNQYRTNNTFSLRNFPINRPCLHRNNNQTRQYNLISEDTINRLIFSAFDYKTFHGDDTSNYHAMIHAIIGGIVGKNREGGELANPYYSPVDPLFYFHHAMIDKIWYKWQIIYNARNMFNYNDNKMENINSIPRPYSSIYNLPNWNVNDMLNLTNNILCYQYDTFTYIRVNRKVRRYYHQNENHDILNHIKIPKESRILKVYSDKVSIIVNDTVKFIFLNRTLPESKILDSNMNNIYKFVINKWDIDPYKIRQFYNKIYKK